MNILLLVTSIVVSLSSAQVVKSADELYNCPIEEVEKLVTERYECSEAESEKLNEYLKSSQITNASGDPDKWRACDIAVKGYDKCMENTIKCMKDEAEVDLASSSVAYSFNAVFVLSDGLSTLNLEDCQEVIEQRPEGYETAGASTSAIQTIFLVTVTFVTALSQFIS